MGIIIEKPVVTHNGLIHSLHRVFAVTVVSSILDALSKGLDIASDIGSGYGPVAFAFDNTKMRMRTAFFQMIPFAIFRAPY